MDGKIKRGVGLVTVVLGSILFASVVQGQEVMSCAKERGGRGYFMFGGGIIDIESLNSRLESKGYSKLSDNFISFGEGGHGVISRVIVGGEGHGLMGKDATSRNYKTSLAAGYGFFDFGYLVYSRGGLNVYPIFGLGGGGISLTIIEKGTPSFGEVLENPKRGAYLSTGGFLLNLALGADYLLKLSGDEEGEGGLVFGLRVGYTFAPIKGDWEMDGIDISNGPEIGITGPYFRLMIGGGGRRK